jgi:hypothetical protein
MNPNHPAHTPPTPTHHSPTPPPQFPLSDYEAELQELLALDDRTAAVELLRRRAAGRVVSAEERGRPAPCIPGRRRFKNAS